MTNKQARQAAILELVAEHVVGSQEELRRLLLARGMDVTQSTLSRDLRDLRLARVSDAGGARYVLAGVACGRRRQAVAGNAVTAVASRGSTASASWSCSTRSPSGAQPIAEAIDLEEFPEVLGTIAGDDTILIVDSVGRGARAQLTRAAASARRRGLSRQDCRAERNFEA